LGGPSGNDAREPPPHRGSHSLEIRLEAVVAPYLHDLACLGGGRHPKRVALTLDDEGRHTHSVELVQSRRLGPSRRVEGKGEAQHGDGAGRLGGAAGHAPAQRPAADDERQTFELAPA
jgi:hypothetical protein